jgi:hypothetical protein
MYEDKKIVVKHKIKACTEDEYQNSLDDIKACLYNIFVKYID